MSKSLSAGIYLYGWYNKKSGSTTLSVHLLRSNNTPPPMQKIMDQEGFTLYVPVSPVSYHQKNLKSGSFSKTYAKKIQPGV